MIAMATTNIRTAVITHPLACADEGNATPGVPSRYSSQRVIRPRVVATDRCQLSPSGTVTTLVTHIGLHDAGLLPAFTTVRHNAYCRLIGYYLYYSITEGGIVGAYGGLVYLSTVLGGWI